jgi:hypothetical protein
MAYELYALRQLVNQPFIEETRNLYAIEGPKHYEHAVQQPTFALSQELLPTRRLGFQKFCQFTECLP